jgi:aminoglycoside 3-N-acetyltransferase
MMAETSMPPISNLPYSDMPYTVESIAADLRALGVEPGMTILLHSSLKKVGWVAGGPVAVILALEEVLTPEGTLVMPTHTADLSDPALWRHPPVVPSWVDPIRRHFPAFDVDLTPTYGMGVIPETFRKQRGVIRGNHPHVSFAAWGKHARYITDDHALTPIFGERSPLARIYDLQGHVLLLGVTHSNDTSLHLAEWRADIPRKTIHSGSPMMVEGVRTWVAWDDIDWDDSGFEELGSDFARETGLQREGLVGHARAMLAPQRPLVDYGVTWLERERNRTSTGTVR